MKTRGLPSLAGPSVFTYLCGNRLMFTNDLHQLNCTEVNIYHTFDILQEIHATRTKQIQLLLNFFLVKLTSKFCRNKRKRVLFFTFKQQKQNEEAH